MNDPDNLSRDMDGWKTKFLAAAAEIQLLIFEINNESVSNDVARFVIEATRNAFLLAIERTLMQRYVLKPFELFDMNPLSIVTNLLLDELLASLKCKGYQTRELEEVIECKIELVKEEDCSALSEIEPAMTSFDDKSCIEQISSTLMTGPGVHNTVLTEREILPPAECNDEVKADDKIQIKFSPDRIDNTLTVCKDVISTEFNGPPANRGYEENSSDHDELESVTNTFEMSNSALTVSKDVISTAFNGPVENPGVEENSSDDGELDSLTNTVETSISNTSILNHSHSLSLEMDLWTNNDIFNFTRETSTQFGAVTRSSKLSSLRDRVFQNCSVSLSNCITNDSNLLKNIVSQTTAESVKDFDICSKGSKKFRCKKVCDKSVKKFGRRCSKGFKKLKCKNVYDKSVKEFGIYSKGPKKFGCKKVYDKVRFCTFCGMMKKGNMLRHLLLQHRSEDRVSDISLLSKDSVERAIRFELLVNEGNFKHNVEVLQQRKGLLVVGCRKSGFHEPKDFIPCEFCCKFLIVGGLITHIRNCRIRKFFQNPNSLVVRAGRVSHCAADNNEVQDEDCSRENRNLFLGCTRRARSLLNCALLQCSSEKKVLLNSLLSRMTEGKIKDVTMTDSILLRYAELKVESLGEINDQKLSAMRRLSQAVRTLSRVVLESRKILPDCSLDQLLQVENFDILVDSAKRLCTNDSGDSGTLFLGSRLGYLLNSATAIKISLCLTNGDTQGFETTNKFKALMNLEWNKRVSRFMSRNPNVKFDQSKAMDIPTAGDLIILRNYIITRMEVLVKRLSVASLKRTTLKQVQINWQELCRLTACRLVLINNRKMSEVSDLLLDAFQNRKQDADSSCEFMSVIERDLAKRMEFIEVFNKLQKNVKGAILIPPECRTAIQLLTSLRTNVGIAQSNNYLFARLNVGSPIGCTSELRNIMNKCSLTNDYERLSTSKSRTFIAAVSRILELKEDEIEQLATYLGYDIKTNQEFNCLLNSSLELTKVTHMLLAVDRGTVNNWKDKSLKDIDIADLPPLFSETDDDDDVQSTETNSDASSSGAQTKTTDFVSPLIEAANSGWLNQPSAGRLHGQGNEHPGSRPVSPNQHMVVDEEPDQEDNYKRKRQGLKRRWNAGENNIFSSLFSAHITNKKMAVGQDIVQACMLLPNRTAAQIRTRLHNMIKDKQKIN